MKTVMMMIATLASFNAASASDNMEKGVSVIHCMLDEGIYDFGINVEIKRVPMLSIPEKRVSRLIATISAFGFDGQPHEMGEYMVSEFKKDIVDGPRVYQGADFKLNINMRALNENGMYPATLKAIDRFGNKMERTMACEFARNVQPTEPRIFN